MFLKVSQAAELMQLSPSKIKAYILAGRLKAFNAGQRGKRPQWRIHQDDLRNILPEPEVSKASRRFSHPSIDI